MTFGLFNSTQNGASWSEIFDWLVPKIVIITGGHSENAVSEYKKAAKSLAGIVNFGAVDGDDHNDFAKDQKVRAYPTFKIYSNGSESLITGKRTARKWISDALTELRHKVDKRLEKIEDDESLW